MPTAPDWYYRKPPNVKHRTGAGGVVARVDDAGRVLVALIRDRGDHEYVLPKGGVELGESIEQAAAREIREEAGFRKLTLLAPLGVGERLSGKKTTWQTTHYFLFVTGEVEGKPTDRRDWEVHWHPLDALPELYWPEQAKIVHDNRDRIAALVRQAAR